LFPVTIADFWGIENLAGIVGVLYFSAAVGVRSNVCRVTLVFCVRVIAVLLTQFSRISQDPP
jgi:hypothetical protein